MIITWRQQTNGCVCGGLGVQMSDRATGPIGLCVTGCPTLWTVRLPHRYLHPQSWGWAGGGDGRGWRGRSGWGCPAPGRCCIWVGDLGEMRQTTKTENKEKKKDGEGGKNKNSLYDIPWKGSLRWLAWDRGAAREEEEEESEAQIAVLVQETGSVQAEAEHEYKPTAVVYEAHIEWVCVRC